MNNNNNHNFEYRQLNSKNLTVLTDKYQRKLDPIRVKKIVAHFNTDLVNPIKVSFRDNRYNVFDGQHTLAALKLRNNNNDLMVDCKVYYGLTEQDEAYLFAQQFGLSKSVETISKLKALHTAGDIDIIEMVELTTKTGLVVDFVKGNAKNRIICVSKLFKIFKSTSPSDFIEILSLIKETWGGMYESLYSEILGGVYCFHSQYKGKYEKVRFVKKVGEISPLAIIREGKAYNDGGDLRFAAQFFNIYNKGLRPFNKLQKN